MTKHQYGDYGFEIYFDGLEGRTPNYPLDFAALERAGAEVLPPWVYSYVAGGAGDESTQRGNVEAFARFMRATKAPPRDPVLAATTDAQIGSNLFTGIGCAICHVRSITTAPPGTVINQGAFTVPAALGNKIIHPFSDFLLHNVGTGDGIVQNGGQGTRNMVRTAPLWGMRSRDRLMHDGDTLTKYEFYDATGSGHFVARLAYRPAQLRAAGHIFQDGFWNCVAPGQRQL